MLTFLQMILHGLDHEIIQFTPVPVLSPPCGLICYSNLKWFDLYDLQMALIFQRYHLVLGSEVALNGLKRGRQEAAVLLSIFSISCKDTKFLKITT